MLGELLGLMVKVAYKGSGKVSAEFIVIRSILIALPWILDSVNIKTVLTSTFMFIVPYSVPYSVLTSSSIVIIVVNSMVNLWHYLFLFQCISWTQCQHLGHF